MAAAKPQSRKVDVTRAKARRAILKIHEREAAKGDKKLPASWQKGGRDYNRVLGHFGSTK